MANIPLAIFRSPGETAPSGRLRSVIEHVPETTPNAGYAAAGNAIAEGAERTGESVGNALSTLGRQQRALKEREREATDLVETGKAYDARVAFFEEGRTKLNEQAFDSTDAARQAYSNLADQARNIGNDNLAKVSKPALARFENHFNTYVRSTTADGVHLAFKQSIERKRGEVLDHLENQKRLYFQMSDPVVRDNIELNMYETIDRAGALVFAPDDAVRLKKKLTADIRENSLREYVDNTPYLEALQTIDERKDLTPEEKDTAISHAHARNSLIEAIQSKTEKAVEKTERDRRNLNEGAYAARIADAMRAGRGNDLLALSLEMRQAAQSKEIDPERQISYESYITSWLHQRASEPERPVKNDRTVVAILQEMRINHDPRAGEFALNAYKQGKLNDSTVNDFVTGQLVSEDKNQYFNNHVYKERMSTLPGNFAALLSPTMQFLSKTSSYVRDGMAEIQSQAKTSFDRDVGEASRRIADPGELSNEIEKIYDATVKRYAPAVEDLNKGPNPRTGSFDEAVKRYGKDPKNRAIFIEEFVALTLAGKLDNVVLSPENAAWRDELKKGAQRGLFQSINK